MEAVHRIASIFVTLTLCVGLCLGLGLGPVAQALSADAPISGWTGKVRESHLPACCRRHGAHHCAMGLSSAATPADAETSVSSTGCCPAFPRSIATAVPPFDSLPETHRPMPLIAEFHSPQQATVAAGISARRSWPKRGPPTSSVL
jgi:hypothetical protein